MRSVDYVFYQNIVQVLIPDVLRPIPSSLTQSIRNFAKGLENWLTGAMNGCPQEMVLIKVIIPLLLLLLLLVLFLFFLKLLGEKKLLLFIY